MPCPKTIIPNTGLCKSLITSNKAGSVPTHILEMEFQFRKRLKGSGLGSTPLKVLLVSTESIACIVNKVLCCNNVLKETTKICHKGIVFRNNLMMQDLSKRGSPITKIHFNFESH